MTDETAREVMRRRASDRVLSSNALFYQLGKDVLELLAALQAAEARATQAEQRATEAERLLVTERERAERLEKALDDEAFYDLMQTYRHAPLVGQEG